MNDLLSSVSKKKKKKKQKRQGRWDEKGKNA